MIFFENISNIDYSSVTFKKQRFPKEVVAYGNCMMNGFRTYESCIERIIKMKKNRKEFKNTPFVALTWELLNSKAYRQLPNSASKALPYFLGKAKIDFRDPGRYETTFPFTYSEAHRYGLAKSTFSKILRDLMKLGFIDPVSKGGLRGTGLTSSIFKLSKRWEDYGTAAFKEINWECFYKDQRQVQEMKHTTPEGELKSLLGGSTC